ncbi:MAG TPA: hypothetical protein VKH81_06210 [Candidatus Angelobacter sp.]|nr:hypothetical protein [Candidatus Angelobacter sp.]
MPLARIFTHHPERTAALSNQLQQQGYTVEVVSPDQAHLSPADLEIEFEICERADVLERAAGLADELHADIAVAPGVIQSPEPAQRPAPVQSSAVPEAQKAPSDREREFEAAFANSSVEELNPAVIEIPVMERAPLPPVAFADDPPAAAPMQAQIVKPADPVPYLAQLTPFGTPQVDAEVQNAALRLENSPEREAARPELPETSPAATGSSIWQRGADFTARAVANAKAIAASTVESFREHSQEYQKKAQIRSAEARAAHEARLLDLEQRRAEAQQRASELESARQAAAARLIELVRQRDPGLHEGSSREQNVFEERVLETEREALPRPAAPRRPSGTDTWWHAAMAVVAKKRPPMSPQLRAVMTGAVAITVLFVVGIVLGSLYPRAPLAKPSTLTGNGAQGGGVTAPTGGVTVRAGGPSKPTPGSKTPQAATTTAAASQPPAHDKPLPKVDQTRRIAAQQGEEDLGDDVVVRHYQRPVPTQKPKQSGQQAGLKHFSDLDTQ